MSRNVKLQVLRGFKANIPLLALGELYLTTDTNELFCGETPGNIPVGIPAFSAAGVRLNNPHIVFGQVTATSNTQLVTLSGSAAFTSAASYTVVANDETANHAIQIVQNSGSSFTLKNQANGDVINFICVGN